jgi:hypothetical protein
MLKITTSAIDYLGEVAKRENRDGSLYFRLYLTAG